MHIQVLHLHPDRSSRQRACYEEPQHTVMSPAASIFAFLSSTVWQPPSPVALPAGDPSQHNKVSITTLSNTCS